MKPTLQSQFEHEQKASQRHLEFYKQENAFLKFRLSEIVDMSDGNGLLQLAEHFQNELLEKDVRMEKLIKKLQGISVAFEKLPASSAIPQSLLLKQQELRNELLTIEKDFICLSKDFNEKISQKI
jgi:hypothetical protein